MNKKGVEMSMNVIIIAAIGLLILLILAFLVVTYVNRTDQGLKSCTAQYGGTCQSACENFDQQVSERTDCEKTGKVCCKVFTATGG